MITNEGGLWDESSRLYPLCGARPFNSTPPYWRFPSGAEISFAHLQHEKNVLDWQGAQIALIGFDELTHFSERQFFYMLSRNRSTCGIRPYVRATTNPDVDSWVRKFIDWWIDPATGLPIPERSGALRWFYRVNEALCWYDTSEEAKAAHPDLAALVEPTSVTFIHASLDDNPALTSKDPSYRAKLMALSKVERERLLGGNWNIRPDAGLVFNRAWFGDFVEAVPIEAQRVRYWDKGGTEDEGDYTVGVLMARDHNGIYYVEDVVRGQWSSHQRDVVIKQTAEIDRQKYSTSPPTILLEQEGGSGGKQSAEISIRELAGYAVATERPTGDKVTRAEPMSSQVEAGNVKIKRASWNEDYLHELEQFPNGAHDDQVDASSGAFNQLALSGSTSNVFSLN